MVVLAIEFMKTSVEHNTEPGGRSTNSQRIFDKKQRRGNDVTMVVEKEVSRTT